MKRLMPDFSARAFLFYPRKLIRALRSWLEISPDKGLFGSDGFELDPDPPLLDWEKFCWSGTRSARQARALALTEMMQDEII